MSIAPDPANQDTPAPNPQEKARATRERKRHERETLLRHGAALVAAAAAPALAKRRNAPRHLGQHLRPDSTTSACVECAHVYVHQRAWDRVEADQHEAWLDAGFRRDGGRGLCEECLSALTSEVEGYLNDFVNPAQPAPEMVQPVLVALDGGAQPGEGARGAADLTLILGQGQPLIVDDRGFDIGLEDFYFPPPMGPWIDEAVCAQIDPELFQSGAGSADQDAATAVCATCPVRLSCLRYALENPKATCTGVWGGYNQYQLEGLRRRAREAARERVAVPLSA
ncbi:WhiB family transcriptional regulator [Nocardioides pakistanensis]